MAGMKVANGLLAIDVEGASCSCCGKPHVTVDYAFSDEEPLQLPGVTPDEARQFAMLLLSAADKSEGKVGN